MKILEKGYPIGWLVFPEWAWALVECSPEEAATLPGLESYNERLGRAYLRSRDNPKIADQIIALGDDWPRS
ncbi:MAG TPA: hypothetical protein VFW87_09540 [Pirellulales bacterium]|nr:hypothetical protein [Pirellulales bacterium]